MESIPQVHIILLIVFAGNVDVDHLKTWIPFAVSVISAAYGMTKFFSVGPCRLIPYDKMGLGSFFSSNWFWGKLQKVYGQSYRNGATHKYRVVFFLTGTPLKS